MCMKSRTGLICDPVDGVVIEPCIDRNGVIAVQAYHTGLMSAFEEYDSKETKHVDFDAIVAIMHETALDMNMKYRESSMGGCALAWEINKDRKNNYAQNQKGDVDLEELAQ